MPSENTFQLRTQKVFSEILLKLNFLSHVALCFIALCMVAAAAEREQLAAFPLSYTRIVVLSPLLYCVYGGELKAILHQTLFAP